MFLSLAFSFFLWISTTINRTVGSYDLVIKNITFEKHSGMFLGMLSDYRRGFVETREYIIVVLVPPKEIIITTSRTDPIFIVEEETIELRCRSVGANPKSTIIWSHRETLLATNNNNTNNNNAFQIREEGEFFDPDKYTEISFIYTVKREDHNVPFICSSWNEKIRDGKSQGLSKSLTIDVKCE